LRFTQLDAHGGGYRYALNDPVNVIDPTGYDGEDLFIALVALLQPELGAALVVVREIQKLEYTANAPGSEGGAEGSGGTDRAGDGSNDTSNDTSNDKKNEVAPAIPQPDQTPKKLVTCHKRGNKYICGPD
jgi:hypothetical protein